MKAIIKFFYRKWTGIKFSKKYGKGNLYDLEDPMMNDDGLKKIAVITMVKNESEIIEHFVRVNSRWADHLYIIDDMSSDNTVAILDSLISEGFNITVLKSQSLTYQQNYVTTDLLRSVAALNAFDYILPIDADEFIFDNIAIKTQLNEARPDSIVVMRWSTMIPTCDSTMAREAALNRFKIIKNEPLVVNKLAVPASLAKSGFLSMGNHDIHFEGSAQHSRQAANFTLAHIPVRSLNQLISKIIVGANKFRLKKNKQHGEGSHWIALFEKLKNSRFTLNDSQLRELTYCYASHAALFDESNIVDLDFDIHTYPIKYTNYNEGTIFMQLSGFIDELVCALEKLNVK